MIATTLGVFALAVSLYNVNIDVPMVMQMPELPTGCEAVSTTMLLNNYGFDIDKSDFTSKYIKCEYELTPRAYKEYFYGNPFSVYGSYCNPYVCCSGVTAYFNELNQGNLRPYDLTLKKFSSVMQIVSLGHPVAIWVTTDYEEPETYKNEFGITCYKKSHCVVLKGYNSSRGTVVLNDPLLGEIEKDYDLIKSLYYKMNTRAFCILDKEV